MTVRFLSKTLSGLSLCLFWSTALVTGAAQGAEDLTPETSAQFIEGLAKETLGVLRNEDATDDQKGAQVKVIVDRGFDLPLISRFVLGRFWRGATEEQLAEYQELFQRGLVESYTHALVASGGTGFQVLNSQKVSETDVLVSSRLERDEGPPIGAGWRVRLIEGVPKIIDVVHEGVSLALTQRQEYASVIERRGLEGLLEILRKRS